MQSAAEELLALGGEGLQLTPGNVPTEGFEGFLEGLREKEVSLRTHHGFTPQALRTPVWSPDAECLVDSRSVHPPRDVDAARDAWVRRAEDGGFQGCVLETMYPGYLLGTGEALLWAMDLRLRLAVDIAHLHIQHASGRLPGHVWRRLQDHLDIEEVHVSANPGDRDAHQPLTLGTFGLEWAQERLAQGTPVILECYMHRLSKDARRSQLDLLRGHS
ncbi:hypothetical protein POL68_29195 [Stigmatella sp. ncwal1]|uniref:Xylose isomerase-like TIM barrel domain-containing protein n=1 Tax=Stigmatella ashevillensis TaxID=2995309 RepID=A0ABT5DFX6_9BACT|nr:hypothetical protein [Stigmatella ashevillena]MDC0712575.1 hypothetical protein [Stigmatella ashevillena]